VYSLDFYCSYTSFVRVVVGQGSKQQNFVVHEPVLMNRSLFFKKALSGTWTEAKERLVNLPEDDPSIFQIYVHLLYTNHIAVVSDKKTPHGENGVQERLELAKLYMLADKLQDVDTKNKALATFIASCLGSPSRHIVTLISSGTVQALYNGTPTGSLARKFLVNLYTEKATGETIKAGKEQHMGLLPAEFTLELLANTLDKRIVVSKSLASGIITQYTET
jgi:hypothetical protein